MQLDQTDTKLLQLLQFNARTPTTDLAKQLRISRTTVHARLNRLEESGAIKGYTIRQGDEIEARRVKAYVLVTCVPRHARQVETGLKAIAEVRSIVSVSGPYDMIIYISAPTSSELDLLLDRIGELEGVERTTSAIILSTKLDR